MGFFCQGSCAARSFSQGVSAVLQQGLPLSQQQAALWAKLQDSVSACGTAWEAASEFSGQLRLAR